MLLLHANSSIQSELLFQRARKSIALLPNAHWPRGGICSIMTKATRTRLLLRSIKMILIISISVASRFIQCNTVFAAEEKLWYKKLDLG